MIFLKIKFTPVYNYLFTCVIICPMCLLFPLTQIRQFAHLVLDTKLGYEIYCRVSKIFLYVLENGNYVHKNFEVYVRSIKEREVNLVKIRINFNDF